MGDDHKEVAPDDIRAYLRTTEKHHEAKTALADEQAEYREGFVDKTGLNKTALAICARLNRLSTEKRADVLRTMDMVREAMAPVWGQQPDMFPPEKTADEKAEANKQARSSARREGASRRAKEQPEQPEKPSAEVTPFPPAWDPVESEPTDAA